MTTRAQYAECSTFTTVYTPHFINSMVTRRHLLPNMLISDMLERLWTVGIENVCTGFKFGQGYVYYKCKWNTGRNRWELELISFTPARNFNTRNNDTATEVYP